MKPFGLDTINEEERITVARTALNNLLTSYADEADVFTEILQNSFDAILLAEKDSLYTGENKPQLTIVIGRRSNGNDYFFVKDNGIGMSKEVANRLTVPGFTHGKKRGKTIGYKGVGASYFFAASQVASLKSISKEGEKTEYTIRGSFNWIKNDEEPEPPFEEKMFVPNFLKEHTPTTRGTAVYFQFHDGMKPKNLDNIVIVGDGVDEEIKNWMSFLSVKSALGSVQDISNLGIEVNVFLDFGDTQYKQVWKIGEFDNENKVIGYPFPYKVLRVGENKSVIDKAEIHLKYKHERRHQAIYYRWTADEIIEETNTLEENEIEALRLYLKWAEGYLCYSVDVLKAINKRLGGRSNILKHGIRIASDGIPQGRMIDLSLTSSQGLDRQSHIVLSFEKLELDTGRKISADETIAGAISKIGQRIISVLKEYRWAMKKKDREDVSSDLESWRTAIDSRAQTSMVREFSSKYNFEPVFTVDPDSESEVIALFISLITHRVLKGYKIQAISGFKRYDSLIDVLPTNEHKNLSEFLSIRNDEVVLNGHQKVLEFKHNFDDILVDFEEKIKNPSEIELIVCWNVPSLNLTRGRIQPTYGKWKDHRCIYGGSYIWFDENETSKIPIISLKNLLAELLAKKETELNLPGIGVGTLRQLESQDESQLI